MPMLFLICCILNKPIKCKVNVSLILSNLVKDLFLHLQCDLAVLTVCRPEDSAPHSAPALPRLRPGPPVRPQSSLGVNTDRGLVGDLIWVIYLQLGVTPLTVLPWPEDSPSNSPWAWWPGAPAGPLCPPCLRDHFRTEEALSHYYTAGSNHSRQDRSTVIDSTDVFWLTFAVIMAVSLSVVAGNAITAHFVFRPFVWEWTQYSNSFYLKVQLIKL